MREEPRFPALFYRQRLNAAGIPMLCGVLLFLLLPDAAPFVLFLLGTLCVFLAVRKEGEGRKTLLCVTAGLSLALLLVGSLGIEKKRAEEYCGKTFLAEGYVTAVRAESFDLALVSLDGSIFLKTVRCESSFSPDQGEKLRLSLTLSAAFPEDCRDEGIDFSAFSHGEGQRVGRSFLYSTVGKMRARLLKTFGEEETGGFLSAILLGQRDGLSAAEKEAFEKTASSHILAISGLHISQFIGFFVCFFGFFPISRRAVRILLYPLVIFLYLLAGAGVSVFRASVMTLFSVTGLLLKRRSDSVTSLVFAACILVIPDPFALENASFLFSYLSTFAMVVCAIPLSAAREKSLSSMEEKKKRLCRPLFAGLSSFTVASSVFVFTLPLQLLMFGEVQPLSPLYALLLVPVFQVCLLFTLFSALLALLPVSLPLVWEGFLSVPSLFLSAVKVLADAAPDPVDFGKMAVPAALLFLFVLLVLMARKEKMERIRLVHLASLVIFGFAALISL